MPILGFNALGLSFEAKEEAMKRILLVGLLIVISFPFTLRAQENTSKTEKTLSEILESIEKAPYELYQIYDLEVLKYYDLESQYETPLQRQVFLKSAEYGDKLNELKNKRAEMLANEYYLAIPNEYDSTAWFPDYDIRRKGFDLMIGENSSAYRDEKGASWCRAPKSIDAGSGSYIIFPSLPTKQIAPYKDRPKPLHVLHEKLFLQIDEEKGLEIEKNKDNTRPISFSKYLARKSCNIDVIFHHHLQLTEI